MSTPFRSILCAVDASPAAARVLRHAAGFAGAFGARLTVLTVTSGAPAAADAALRAQLSALLPARAPYLPAPDVQVVKLAMGAVVDAILTAVDDDTDLIVTGTHSKSGISRWLLGSTSAALLAETPCPALLVPPGTIDIVDLGAERADLRPGAVLAAVDPAEANLRQLTLAAACASRSGHPLVAMTVARAGQPEATAHEALAARLADAGVSSARLVVRTGVVADEIDRAAVEAHAGLVVMGLSERGARGEVATAVLKAKDALVLAVPPAAR